METIKTTKDEFDEKAADAIKKEIDSLLIKKQFVVFGIPGGRSAAAIFEKLKEKQIRWDKVHMFMVDERKVPIDDPESNFKIAKEHIISKINIDPGNVHPFLVDKGVGNYEEKLNQYGGKYDLLLLSAGEDGHVGALYPCHHSFDDESEFFIEMDDSPKPPKERISISRKSLQKAESAVILFIGDSKQEAYDKFRDDNTTERECPAKLVKNLASAYIVTDRE